MKPERACVLVGLAKSSWHYLAKPRQDSELRQQIHDLARRYPRRGYRFIHALLVRAGAIINKKKVRRIWREEGLAIKPKGSRKIRTGATIPMQAEYANHVWTYDFIFDQTLEGTTLKILTLTDEFTRQSLALQVATSFTSKEVRGVLQDVVAGRGAPDFIRSDNGSEFIARELGIWLAVQDIGTRFIEPGKPWQNGFAESFHSRLRAECLNQEVFYSAKHAQVLLDDWRAFYNARRPHSSLGYRTPDEFAEQARGRQAAPFAETTPQMWPSARPLGEQESRCSTFELSRVSTRNRPTFGATPVIGCRRPPGRSDLACDSVRRFIPLCRPRAA
ncbi:IS3 family transposase [Deinococcus radiopugnans]|uniref:IS3 family transposase n=1 Tax=Deinococcus radiopugnans TaxID=57497 RepID=UPI0036D282D2